MIHLIYIYVYIFTITASNLTAYFRENLVGLVHAVGSCPMLPYCAASEKGKISKQ